MAERLNPNIFQIVIGQFGQQLAVDIIIGKARGVLYQAQIVQPRGDIIRHSRISRL